MDLKEMERRFRLLCDAVERKETSLLHCVVSSTGEPVGLICVVKRLANGLLDFQPIAKLFDEPMAEIRFPAPPINPEWRAEMN